VIGLALFAAWLGEAERRVTANEWTRRRSVADDRTFRLG
jgi:hypothetical protein